MASVESYQTVHGRRWRVRYRKPDRTQAAKRGFRTKREAEEFIASVEVSKSRGEWVDPTRSRATVGELATAWYAAQLQVKPTTLSGYRHNLDKHVLPRWGRTRLVDVAHVDVQTWVAELSARLAPSTVRQIELVLSGILRYAILDGRLVRNPCDHVRLPRVERQHRGYLSHQQVAELANEVGAQGDVVLFLAYTGLRWGEMAALRVRRVDLQRMRLDIVEAVTEPRGVLIFGTPKSHERRSVPFPQMLAPILERRLAGKGDDDLLFAGTDGGVLRNGNFRHRFFDAAVQRIRDRDESFPRVTPHDLRHTAASLAVSSGANVKAVQRMLGHASASMTLDVYTDLFEDDLDRVALALNQQARASGATARWATWSEQPDFNPAWSEPDERRGEAPDAQPRLW